MDPLPLIPENQANHEAAPILRTVLQDTLDGHIYPKQVAEQFVKAINDEDASLRINAKNVLEIHERAQEITTKVQLAGADIMFQNALYFLQKDKIDNSFELREKIKLARCNLFKQLEEEFILEFNLLQSSDLFPNMIHRYLDFRNHQHSICPACKSKVKLKSVKQKENNVIRRSLQADTVTLIKEQKSFQIFPKCVIFHNYELDEVYKKNVKIINTSSTIQGIAIKHLPTSQYFTAIISNNQKIAPGMSITITITFKPKIFRNIEDVVILKNKEGELAELVIGCTRDLPKLITCIFKSNSNLLDKCEPGSNNFVEKRREALNSTIDCGSCLVSQYVLVSIILENKGKDGKFFIMTEDDWFFQNVETVSTSMELFKGDFWIYPTFFEILSDEVAEINIIFQPSKPGLHVETLYLICDNNAFEQIELMGDAVEFTKHFIEIDIPPNDTVVNKKHGYCIYMGNVKNGTTQNLVIIVRNKSCILLSCEWQFSNKPRDGVNNINSDWITQRSYHTKLAPNGAIEYEFKIHFDAETNGYHNIFFDFFVTNIPMISLEENGAYRIIERDEIHDKSLSKAADVLIKQIEVCAMIEMPTPKPAAIECLCDKICETEQPKMGFSCPFIKFGILPSGINVQKEFYIRNDWYNDLNWSILEVKYNLDCSPHMNIIKNSPHLSESSGYCQKYRNRKMFYKTVNKKPISWVSILVLISVNSKMESEIEDICIITYEIVNFDIAIKTKHSKHAVPALMPMHVMYRGIPTEIKFGIENRSHITGYFQFFPPFGEDRDRLLLEFHPSSSIIKPLETIVITAKLICCDIGFIQNFFVPCFIGMGQEPLMLRVLCTVDGPHVVFYLPVEKNRHKKITWPPKLVYEYDTDPWCVCKNKECMEAEDPGPIYFPNYQEPPFENLLTKTSEVTYTVCDSCTQGTKTDTDNSAQNTIISDTPSIKTRRLEGIISEEFETEQMLHDDIVEIHRVPVLTPTKVTVFIQNITPIATKFTFEPQRFVENKKFDHVAVRLHLKKRDELWNDLMGTEYGILVQPEISSGALNPYESVEIDTWIYANTYGIYSEEIVVELLEMPSYHFSMLIEVIGSPLILPMAINCVTKNPTIRFSTVPFDSDPLTRKIKITNTSSVAVHVMWYAFLKKPNDQDQNFDPKDAFNIFLQMANEEHSDKVLELVFSMDEYCGKNMSEFCYVEPNETDVKEHSSVFIQVVIRPQYFDVQSGYLDTISCLIGHLFLQPEKRKKLNYFIRKIGPDVNSLKINVTIRIEKPSLELEIGNSEYVKMHIYANDILLKKNYEMTKYTVLRNFGGSTYLLELVIEEPFYFKMKNGKLKKKLYIKIAPFGTHELIICCCIYYDQILALSELVYENGCLSGKYPFCKKMDDLGRVCHIDYDEKSIQINKSMNVLRNEDIIQFPMVANIYYPRISVTPLSVMFQTVLLRNTFKSVLTIYNYTGYEVKFEIYKSSGAQCFLVIPHYGEVPPSQGSHKSFINVYIYFCPTECRKYRESLRVVTNIPNYWHEVQLRGIGSMNAKFSINYKI